MRRAFKIAVLPLAAAVLFLGAPPKADAEEKVKGPFLWSAAAAPPFKGRIDKGPLRPSVTPEAPDAETVAVNVTVRVINEYPRREPFGPYGFDGGAFRKGAFQSDWARYAGARFHYGY